MRNETIHRDTLPGNRCVFFVNERDSLLLLLLVRFRSAFLADEKFRYASNSGYGSGEYYSPSSSVDFPTLAG